MVGTLALPLCARCASDAWRGLDPLATALLCSLIGQLMFFGTDHSYSFGSLQFSCAFVGFEDVSCFEFVFVCVSNCAHQISTLVEKQQGLLASKRTDDAAQHVCGSNNGADSDAVRARRQRAANHLSLDLTSQSLVSSTAVTRRHRNAGICCTFRDTIDTLHVVCLSSSKTFNGARARSIFFCNIPLIYSFLWYFMLGLASFRS
jgi:hypothetical protein